MRILLCNNFVRNGSGIDSIVRLEESCLSEAGHDVRVFGRDNRSFDEGGHLTAARLAAGTLYGKGVARDLDRQLAAETYDIVHVHNTVPLLTGAVYDAVRRHPAITLVQSLHNYRAACLYSYFYRSGRRCHICERVGPAGCVLYRCYGGSFFRSAVLATARVIDRLHGRQFGLDADHFLAVSSYVRDRHVRLGMPGEKISVLPNAGDDLGQRTGPPRKKLVYVGAVIEAKGARVLPTLARALPDTEIHVIGEGDLMDWLRAEATSCPNLRLHGFLDRTAKRDVWQDAHFTLVPSLWEEPFGLTAVESFSLGIPVMTTGSGGLTDIVTAGENGCLLPFDSTAAVVDLIRRYAADGDDYRTLCRNARHAFESRYARHVYAARLESTLAACVRAHRSPGSNER